MTHEIAMPDLEWGDGIEIKLVAWLKRPGDPVKAGEPIAEVLSEKANVELESDVAGVVAELLVQEDAIVTVGQPLIRITTDSQEGNVT